VARLIGSPQPRRDALEKVRGAARYTADIHLDGALSATVLRSPHSMAKIRSIDLRHAEAMPGVAAIAYSGNTPHKPLDFGIKDQHLFPPTYVRYRGEPVAAVAADTDEHARAAANAIEIAYEPMPAVLSIDAAVARDAALVHPDWKTYEKTRNRVLKGNVCGYSRVHRGDVEAALKRADVVVESRFTFSAGIPGYIEPRAALARREPDGGLTVWCGSQSPYGNREELAEFFDLPLDTVRFINQYVGGAFGGKILMAAEWYAAALALAGSLYARFLEVDRALWYNPYHDRSAHYLFGLRLATDIQNGRVLRLLHDLDQARWRAVRLAGDFGRGCSDASRERDDLPVE